MIVVVVDSVDREVRAGSGAHAALARVAARRGGVRLLPCTLPFGRETISRGAVRSAGVEAPTAFLGCPLRRRLMTPSGRWLSTPMASAAWGDAADFVTSYVLSREGKIGVGLTRLLDSNDSSTFLPLR